MLGIPLSELNRRMGEALEALVEVVPYDLATFLAAEGNVFSVRWAGGPMHHPGVDAHQIPLDAHTALREVLRTGVTRVLTQADHLGIEGDPFDGVVDFPPGHACVVAPCGPFGVITVDRVAPAFEAPVVKLVSLIARFASESVGRTVRPLAASEKEAIMTALRHTGGRIHGVDGAAALLGLHPNTLRSRMHKHGLGGARAHRGRESD